MFIYLYLETLKATFGCNAPKMTDINEPFVITVNTLLSQNGNLQHCSVYHYTGERINRVHILDSVFSLHGSCITMTMGITICDDML